MLLYEDMWAVNALCEAVDIADTQRVAQALVRVFEYYKNTRILLQSVISKEVRTTGTHPSCNYAITYSSLFRESRNSIPQ